MLKFTVVRYLVGLEVIQEKAKPKTNLFPMNTMQEAQQATPGL